MKKHRFHAHRFFLLNVLLHLLGPCCEGLSNFGDSRALPHRRSLLATIDDARKQLQQNGPAENLDRLAVVFLLSDLGRNDKDRLAMLQACLKLCATNLFTATPSSVYIFTHQSQVDQVRQGLGEQLRANMAVLALDSKSWVVPPMALNQSFWHSFMPRDYRLMGDWRMSFMPAFAREMGHRYVMQLDDDSYVMSPVAEDLVKLFDRAGYVLGARRRHWDIPAVTWGLPELARYFLTTHKVVPTTLFEYCDPPNMEGLYSVFDSRSFEKMLPAQEVDSLRLLGLPDRGGWNRTVLYGNCIMYSLDWWFQPLVNRFVQLCRATGGSFSYRWNEQGVIAMLWQIFVPREQFYKFEFRYAHRIPPEAAVRRVPTLKQRKLGVKRS